jgi:hypothetical protein
MAILRDAMTVRWLLLVSALLLACGCDGEATGPTAGSETHFLSWCSSAGSCGEGLDCLCGVCTASCSATASCASLAASAECLAVGSRPADQACPDAVAAFCEVACSVDADCAPLGGAHRCDRGFCRRLAPECPTQQVSASEVVVLGDAFLAESGQVTAELEALARSAGALGAAENYRDYSSSLITPFGGVADLTDQYATALAEGPVRVVVMDVGGPDSLLTCPDPPTQTCPALQNAISGADALWQQMAADGVEAVIDFFYPDPGDATLQAKFDVLRPLMQATCDGSPAACYWLDLQPTFAGRAQEYLLPGGINPTAAGSAATAQAIWSVMQQNCIAQ